MRNETDTAGAALVEQFLENVKRETASLHERIDRMAVDLDNKLFDLDERFEVDYGWRLGSRLTSEFWVKVIYPMSEIREAS